MASPTSRTRRTPPRGVLATCVLLYLAAFVLPGLHLTLVSHAWSYSGGTVAVHSCGAHSERSLDRSDAERGGDPALRSGDHERIPGEACPLAGRELPKQPARTWTQHLGSQRLCEHRPLSPADAPRVPGIALVLLAPKTSPPRAL